MFAVLLLWSHAAVASGFTLADEPPPPPRIPDVEIIGRLEVGAGAGVQPSFRGASPERFGAGALHGDVAIVVEWWERTDALAFRGQIDGSSELFCDETTAVQAGAMKLGRTRPAQGRLYAGAGALIGIEGAGIRDSCGLFSGSGRAEYDGPLTPVFTGRVELGLELRHSDFIVRPGLSAHIGTTGSAAVQASLSVGLASPWKGRGRP